MCLCLFIFDLRGETIDVETSMVQILDWGPHQSSIQKGSCYSSPLPFLRSPLQPLGLVYYSSKDCLWKATHGQRQHVTFPSSVLSPKMLPYHCATTCIAHSWRIVVALPYSLEWVRFVAECNRGFSSFRCHKAKHPVCSICTPPLAAVFAA